ncbi:MAG: hypothetical protein KAX66_06945 [Propionivibrio sp.]|nr:hypothetical protein [Propionivibrio sp.]MBP8215187.1 hypothetical protein [Propionivibrio sp.]
MNIANRLIEQANGDRCATANRVRRSLVLVSLFWPFAGLANMEAAETDSPLGLQRWGSGEFRRFGFLVYEATLWAGDDPQRPPLALRLDYKRKIDGSAIADASVSEMRKLGVDEKMLAVWGEQMLWLFPDVAPGDSLIGHYRADGASFSFNGKPIGEIADPEFAERFFAIWLDPKTSAPELRVALLKRPRIDGEG